MADRPTRSVVTVAAIAACIAVVLLAGSVIYWIDEGKPGTPEQFRQRVRDTGLVVAWDTYGPRGGTGIVDASCGPVTIDVYLIDDELWVNSTSDPQVLLTPDTIESIVSYNE